MAACVVLVGQLKWPSVSFFPMLLLCVVFRVNTASSGSCSMLVKQAGALQHSTVGVLSEHGACSINISSTRESKPTRTPWALNRQNALLGLKLLVQNVDSIGWNLNDPRE